MAKEFSFDVVSNVDIQEVDNALNQAQKEIATRYDFRGSQSKVEWTGEEIILIGDDDFKLRAVNDIVRGKLVKRGISLKNIDAQKPEPASGGTLRQRLLIMQGLSKENAKNVVKLIKDAKIKVNVQIMDTQVRVSGKDKDDLQRVIALLKESDFPVELQFTNYR